MNRQPPLPDDIEKALKKAGRLEWLTLFWMSVIVIVMYFAMGGSQAFKTAWIEDVLSLLAPVLFLISRKIETHGPTRGFPFGFQRIGTLAFFLSAVALCAIGGFLLYEGMYGLLSASHPTVGSKQIFGREIWMGWVMIGALTFSVIPPVILGRMKRKVAAELHDKVLYVDAETNAADWQTGIASILGVTGIALGLWWADAAMASLISLSIIRDGVTALKGSTISLLDGMPRALDSHHFDENSLALKRKLQELYPGRIIQIRETGRYLRARIQPENELYLPRETAGKLMGKNAWRLIELDALHAITPAHMVKYSGNEECTDRNMADDAGLR